MQHWKTYRLYFVATPLQRAAYLAGMLFFFGLMLWVLPYTGLWMEALACAAVGVFCLLELANVVVVTPEGVGHYHNFAMKCQIPWNQVERIAITMEGKRPSLYFYGAGMHFSADKQTKLWQEALHGIGLPEEERKAFLQLDTGSDYVKEWCDGERTLLLERHFVQLDRLVGKQAFVTYEVRITYPLKEETEKV